MLTLLREAKMLQQHVEPVVGQPTAGKQEVRGHLYHLGSLTGIQPQQQATGIINTRDVPFQTFHHH